MHDLLHSEERAKYRHYGELLIAETAEQAGLLIYNFKEGRTKTFSLITISVCIGSTWITTNTPSV